MTIHLKHADAYDNWHFGGPTNGVRSRLATKQFLEIVDPDKVTVSEPSIDMVNLDNAAYIGVHTATYVRQVRDGWADEWFGVRHDLGHLAELMFNGTVELMNEVQPGELGIHWQGAKHHAAYNHSSGFCVFNDMAYVARTLANAGEHVFYLDWDAHHGDGVEVLTRSTRRVTTYSIHEHGIFPGTGLFSNPDRSVYNVALSPGSGNTELADAVEGAIDLMSPDVTTILLAAGADGALGDPLSTLAYTETGYRVAVSMVGQAAVDRGARVILGGAGGYRPEDLTPTVWAHTAAHLASTMGLT